MTVCKGCGLEKDPSLFYSSNKSKCKDCVKIAVRKNRVENIDHYREFDRKRNSDPERVAARFEYQQTDAGKASKKKTIQRYIENNPKKRSVHVKVGNAIRDGYLVKQPCNVCKTSENIVAHHCDYDKPYEIMWLCAQHHTDWHVEHGEALNAQ